jgi:topoisomerase-4 subunit A
MLAETRKGRQVMRPRGDARLAVARLLAEGDDHVAIIGANRKLLVFPLAELPEQEAGQGVTLQKYRDGSLADLISFRLADGLSWPMGGESGRTRTESDLGPWIGSRGSAGRLPPTGFPRSGRFGG